MVFRLEAKPEPTAFVSAEHFAGTTSKVRRRKKMSSHAPAAKGKYKIITYCPTCRETHADQAHPETAPHVSVQTRQKKASCRNGHVWATGSKSI